MAERSTSGPSREEIIARLDEHKGTVYVWSTLSEKYGPPKNAWGSFCRLVIREYKASSNASTGTSINGNNNAPSNGQSNALDSVASSNSGSKTANVTEHSTQNVPMVIVREADAIIHPHDPLTAAAMFPDAEDAVNVLLVVRDPLYQQLNRPTLVQPQATIKQNFVEETFALMAQMYLYLTMFRAVFGNR